MTTSLFAKEANKMLSSTINTRLVAIYVCYVLGSKLWESKVDGLLSLVKKYIVDIWKI